MFCVIYGQLVVVVSQRLDQYALEQDMLVTEVCIYTCGFCHLSYMLSVDQVPVPFTKQLVIISKKCELKWL